MHTVPIRTRALYTNVYFKMTVYLGVSDGQREQHDARAAQHGERRVATFTEHVDAAVVAPREHQRARRPQAHTPAPARMRPHVYTRLTNKLYY